MKTKLQNWQAGEVLVGKVGNSALFLSRKPVANYRQIKFFVPGKAQITIQVSKGKHLVTCFFQDELPRRAQNLSLGDREDPSHFNQMFVKEYGDYISASVPNVKP